MKAFIFGGLTEKHSSDVLDSLDPSENILVNAKVGLLLARLYSRNYYITTHRIFIREKRLFKTNIYTLPLFDILSLFVQHGLFYSSIMIELRFKKDKIFLTNVPKKAACKIQQVIRFPFITGNEEQPKICL